MKNRILRLSLTLLFSFLSIVFIKAQHTDFARVDSCYNLFLLESGLSEYIAINNVSVVNRKLVLELNFMSDNVDTISANWFVLSQQMRQNHNFGLDELLFYRFLKISFQNHSDIVIFITDVLHNKILYVVDFDVKRNMVRTKHNFVLKRSIVTTDLKLSKIKIDKAAQIHFTDKNPERQYVYAQILHWAREHFRKEGATLVEETTPNEDVLKFKVHTIKNEVLSTDNFWFCYLINWIFNDSGCDFRPYEYLKFEIKFQQHEKNEALLNIVIDGRYSPVYGKPADWGKCTDMNLQFDDEFKTYASKIKIELSRLF